MYAAMFCHPEIGSKLRDCGSALLIMENQLLIVYMCYTAAAKLFEYSSLSIHYQYIVFALSLP
jgi:hypothetical protein